MTNTPLNNEPQNNIFILKEIIKETDDVSTFRFIPEQGGMFSFVAGQFVSLYFLNEDFGGQGKSYTISSLPGENFLDLSVKKLGEFSSAIHNLKPGNKVKIIGPSGNFYPMPPFGDLVLLAGGIGISPFYSIICDLEKVNDLQKHQIYLFHSVKKKKHVVFSEKFARISEHCKNFKIIYTVTQEKSTDPPAAEERRIDWEMIHKHSGEADGKEYFICGSISFVHDLWQKLKRGGVKEEHIFTESFY
ncbi:MAG: FAD-dependent oxidoreductase [bacterium]